MITTQLDAYQVVDLQPLFHSYAVQATVVRGSTMQRTAGNRKYTTQNIHFIMFMIKLL